MVAAAAEATVHRFAALEVVMPEGDPIRILDGASEVTWTDGGVERTFVGEDDTYGALGSLSAVTEGIGTEAPRLKFSLKPPTLAASAALVQPGVQGAPVTLWLGLVHPQTGLVLPDPEVLFVGNLDVPKYMRGKGRRVVDLDAHSAWESLFAVEEGQRLNDAFHARSYPAELGLVYVTEVERQMPWGGDGARPVLVSSRGSGGIGGIGGGGTVGGWTGGSGGGGVGGNPYTRPTLWL
jgi:hypothetical protein